MESLKLSESRSLRQITISLLINKGHKDFEDLETQGPRYNFVPINPKDEREQVKNRALCAIGVSPGLF